MTIQECIENFNKNSNEDVYFLIGENTLDRYKLYVRDNSNCIIEGFKWSKKYESFVGNRYETNIRPFFKSTNKWLEANTVIKFFNNKFNFNETELSGALEKFSYSKKEKKILNK